MNNFQLQIILFAFVYFARAQTGTSTESDFTSMVSTLISSIPSSVIPTLSSTISYATPPTTTPNDSSQPTSTEMSMSSVSTISDTTGSASSATATISNTLLQSASTEMSMSPVSAVSDTTGNVSSATATISNTSLQSAATATVMSTSIASHATDNFSSIASPTIIQSSYTSSIIPNTSIGNSSSYQITTQPTTSPTINTSIALRYKYVVGSPVALKIGIINDTTALQSVQSMVSSSFNLPNFTITVTQAEIRLTAKANNAYDMITDLLFSSSRTICDLNCIQSSLLTPTQNLTLPADNGTLVSATVTSAPTIFIETTTTTTNAPINYQKGESPPGLAARLGMGFGITIITVLIIGEIIFLYRKYGLTSSTRETNYEIPTYHSRPSI